MRDAARDVGSAVIGTLVPCVAFLVGIAVAGLWVDGKDLGLRDDATPANVALYFGLFFVAPTFLPIWLTSSRRSRVAVVALLSATALFAGVQVMAIDDAQAGFAVFLVPMASVALAVVIVAAGAVRGRRRSDR